MTRPVYADLQYETSGQDVYRIEPAGAFSRVSYEGSESLSVQEEGKTWRFHAHARYHRIGPDGNDRGEADFVQVQLPDGSFEDRGDDDPDFLTILNQPFAVRLDAATLRDLRALRGRVPFSATSPLGAESVLRGFLRPGAGGPISGRPTVAVRFEAEGTMNGPLPGDTTALVTGNIRMDGTAYYALESAMLMALRVTLTLDAQLAQSGTAAAVPLHIVYVRSIRVARTPPPAPLATGDGTAARATP